MPRNYDTTGHRPYYRIPDFVGGLSTNGTPFMRYVEVRAIVDGDGKVQQLEGPPLSHTMEFDKITEPVQVVDPATGKDIPGMTITKDLLQLYMLAFFRADQKRRDAEADAAEEAARAAQVAQAAAQAAAEEAAQAAQAAAEETAQAAQVAAEEAAQDVQP